MSLRTILPIFQNLFFLITLILFFLGLFGYFYRHEPNYCEMTYMFENPTYHQISMPKEIEKHYRRYSLYSYCEGVRCESHRRNQFTGHPVLFIVGNADSYRQVRSLGSVAYRMGDQKKQLDYFSIDFNEELSALFGGVLEQQTEFVAYAIQTILSLYKTERTVILVGNSIGGLLCRAVFLQPSNRFNPKSVRLIITQATPHQAPVIHSDSYIIDFYARVNHFWKTEWDRTLEHLVLLSLAGGDRDHLVRSDLCSLNNLTDSSRSIDVLTSAVPHVWTSTDHRCIVWCRQLALATTRALLEIVEKKSSNPQMIMQILRRYFSPKVDLSSGLAAKLQLKTEPILITESFVSLTSKKSTDYLLPLKTSSFQTIILHLSQARVYLKQNDDLTDITNNLLPIPPTYGNRQMIRLEINQLSDYDAVLIHLENSKSQIDVYQISNAEQTINLSTFGSQTFTFSQTSYQKLLFPTLTRLWQVYQITLSSPSSDSKQSPFIHFHVPWSNEDLYNFISLRNPSSPSSHLPQPLQRQIRLKLHRLPSSSSNSFPSLELYLQPNTTYELQINSSFLDILSQLVRYYIFLLPTFLFTVLCISYSIQTKVLNLRTYQTMLAWQVHVPVAILITILYKLLIVCLPSINFVTNLHSNGYYFFFLPLMLYFLALSLWACVSFVIDYLIFDPIHRVIYLIFTSAQNELNQQVKLGKLLQTIGLTLPLLSTLVFSGSNGHIALFLIASIHIIWRRTINRRLQEIFTTLLLFHGLLVLLHLTGFIIHLKSILVEGLYPLNTMMSDCSFLSAICAILAFYSRFIFIRSQWTLISKIQAVFIRYNQWVPILLGISAQFLCSYSMYYLWIFICVIFIHVAVIYFLPRYQDKRQ